MLRVPITLSILVIASLTLAQPGVGQKAASNPAITPQPRIAQWWFARHAEKIGEMSKGKAKLRSVFRSTPSL